MPIESLVILVTLIAGAAIGAATAAAIVRSSSRSAKAALERDLAGLRTELDKAGAHLETARTELEKDRAVHAERLKAYGDAEARLRDAFQALSADALKTNNQAFLDLAETRLREARTEAATDIDARKQGDRGSARADGEDARAGGPRDHATPSAAASRPARS